MKSMNHTSKTKPTKFRYFFLVVLALFVYGKAFPQTKLNSNDVKVSIFGTSNIHDWEMRGDKGNSTATFSIQNNVLQSLANLNFSINAEHLKSEHDAMDNNCYKALKTKQYPTISFTAPTTTLKKISGDTYQIVAKGKLLISGVSKDITLTGTCSLNPNGTVTCKGSYKLKMTEYNVEPPSIMMGAIVTGDEVTLTYTLTFN